jgi:hypothetical protein
MKAPIASDDCRVLAKTLVAVKLSEIFEQALDQIERVRAIRMTRQLHPLKSSAWFGVGRRRFGLGLSFFTFFHF